MSEKKEQAAASAPGAEVAAQAPLEGTVMPAVERVSLLDMLIQDLREQAENGPDPETVLMDRILGQIMNAETVEEALSTNEPLGPTDVFDEPLIVHGISFTEGDIEDSAIPYYASIYAYREKTRRQVVVNAGGTQIMAQAMWLVRRNSWPVRCMIVEVGKAKQGRSRPQRLILLDEGDKRNLPF